MATTTTTSDKEMNVYQKLLKARLMFLGSDAKKSGKNMQLAFKYFELDDIVPVATKIFEEVGLISLVNFTGDIAGITIVNTDNPDEQILFTAPFDKISPIVSNAGKQVTNEMQSLGSSITYMRRYLYMIALDICEPDALDSMLPHDTTIRDVAQAVMDSIPSSPVASSTPVVAITPTAPANADESKPLTSGSGNASTTQIRQLKDLLIKLREKDPSKEDMIAQIAVQTNGFTTLSKADCETLVIKIGEMLKEGE